jgi:MYXO-CTERM domain-containing protein
MTTPEWTDREGSDPGITLLQLFAFLAVALIGWLLVRRRRSSADTGGG